MSTDNGTKCLLVNATTAKAEQLKTSLDITRDSEKHLMSGALYSLLGCSLGAPNVARQRVNQMYLTLKKIRMTFSYHILVCKKFTQYHVHFTVNQKDSFILSIYSETWAASAPCLNFLRMASSAKILTSILWDV